MSTIEQEVSNRFKCPAKIWKKFSDRQKATYNNIRSFKQDQIYPHLTIDEKEFEVVSHNYACLAAWEL